MPANPQKNALRVAYGFTGRVQDEMEVVQGFMDVAEKEGWQVVLLHEQFEMQLRSLIIRAAVDAVVGDFISEQWLDSLPESLPRVHRGSGPLGKNISSVNLNINALFEQAATHFSEMGYGEVFYFSPNRTEELPWIRSRSALREILLTTTSPGILCASDYWARQGIQLARSLGKRVPEDVGFVGVGDRHLDGLLADIGISSFPLPHRELGRMTAMLLQEQLSGMPARRVKVSPGRLIPRESSRKQIEDVDLRSRLDEFLLPLLADPPPVEEWARRLGMSRRSFENTFAKENGCTPYVYFMQIRIQEAERLLRDSDWTIARIGQAVGIPDPPRFSAFFRKATGQTPSEWRREERASRPNGL